MAEIVRAAVTSNGASRRSDPGTVDQHPQRRHLDRGVNGGLHLVGIGHVGVNEPTIDFGSHLIAERILEVEHHDLHPVAGKPASGRRPQAGRTTRDDGRTALDVHDQSPSGTLSATVVRNQRARPTEPTRTVHDMSEPNLGEMETLARALDDYRAVVVWKLEGLSEEDARRPMVPSGTNLLGVVKHLAFVERWWYQAVLGQSDPEFPWTEDDPDADWRIEDGDTVESIIALYGAECAKSREVHDSFADGADLVPFGDSETSARSVIVHMLEEIARHVGHMDIIREQIDGGTGWGPPRSE